MTLPGIHLEIRFEEAIEAHLLAHGWTKGSVVNYDAKRALDLRELFDFIHTTQAKGWARLVLNHGGDDGRAREKFVDRLTRQIDQKGTIEVLRRGVDDTGVHFDLAYFRPASGITSELVAAYDANRLTITRQLPYAPGHHRTLDCAMFINGLPVATAELKNPLTGQSIENAKAQYRADRDSRDTFLSRRAIVHFGVDPDEVAMTTRLENGSTAFLPFNRGRDNGKGNPTNAAGYATSYLWEEVWQRDNWLDLFGRFVTKVEETNDNGKTETKILFPRFHQWDAVRKLVAHALTHGSGQNYLVQHSAGSGKSNTIAWTAYRLATLHDDADSRVFDQVIVVTDRRALDQQLQATVKQFERTPGMVAVIDKDSAQLATAIRSPMTRIVVTTLQKFPVVMKELRDEKKARYAVIVDEAHSSQTGKTAAALKVVLGAGSLAGLDAAAASDAAAEAENDGEDLVLDLASRGRQPNISFFAFTATPKHKTLELFGNKRADGNLQPFHLYSMRQAIEEAFIVDVLRNYSTYATYWKIARTVADDPELDASRAAAAIAQIVSLDRHNLDEKARIIAEHFRQVTSAKIGGHAKAMVVTRSRAHAVLQKQAIDRYLANQGIKGIHTLVAFSGTVAINGVDHTEPGMNGFAVKLLPKHFKSDAYQILVVAEKYQTGFDEPLLHTMYVDKKLENVKAVQTLSRLNRKHPGKEETFVLDFVNRTEDIQEAFRAFYETTITEPTDPNLLYTRRDEIEDHDVIRTVDVDAFLKILASEPVGAHAGLYAHLDPARDRWRALPAEDRERFRGALDAYVRLYAFLSQVVPFASPELEILYLYGGSLIKRLDRLASAGLDVGEDIELTHLRTEFTGTHDLSLSNGEEVILPGFTGEGTGPIEPPKKAKLSEIVDSLNSKFGLGLGQADQLYFDQLVEVMAADAKLAQVAKVNTIDNFEFDYSRAFDSAVVDQRDANETLFRQIMSNDALAAELRRLIMPAVYQALREPKPHDARIDDPPTN